MPDPIFRHADRDGINLTWLTVIFAAIRNGFERSQSESDAEILGRPSCC
nr:hypothetical protein [Marinicella sp. W31]MDC2875646.1 hypothetical protein [Marinicella sp. W31]